MGKNMKRENKLGKERRRRGELWVIADNDGEKMREK